MPCRWTTISCGQVRANRVKRSIHNVATDYVYNLYVNGEDSQFYMCKEKINAMVVETMVNDLHKDVLLGCQDKTIRLIRVSVERWIVCN